MKKSWNKYKSTWYLKYIAMKIRWNSELNEFWTKVLHVSVTIGGACIGILSVNGMYNLTSVGVSPIIFTVCGYILTACGAMGVAAKLTKE